MKRVQNQLQGFTLVEALISTAIILVSIITIISVHSLYLRTALANSEAIQATYLAEEGVEVVRFWHNLSWSDKIATIPLDTPYGLSFNGTSWATSTNQYVGLFQRRIMFSAVERNVSSDIVTSGGTVDSNTLLVTSQVSWAKGGATTTKTIMTYITNLYEN